MKRRLLTLAAATALAAPVFAQSAERRATFTGGDSNGTGKCTIEVYVDSSADVEIRGDRGFLRTRSGQPAQWRRFVCTGPMPVNPGEFRFIGIDGRGRQDLVQNPGNGRGAAVVSIQDPDGGAEGYTFDLVWRGGELGPGSTGRPFGGRDQVNGSYQGASQDSAERACQEAVRDRANRQYGLREIGFSALNSDDNPGRNDTIVGYFETRRGGARDTYRFSCAVNLANGRVRSVDISRARETAGADRYGNDRYANDRYANDRYAGDTSACQRAAEQRILRDGYRNAQFGWANAGNRRNSGIAGTATAQRGNNGRAYTFDVRCSVNTDNGEIRSVDVKRR